MKFLNICVYKQILLVIKPHFINKDKTHFYKLFESRIFVKCVFYRELTFSHKHIICCELC